LAVCAFRHEYVPENWLIVLETRGATAPVCPRCLTLIIVHRRVHHMKLEQVIPQMAMSDETS